MLDAQTVTRYRSKEGSGYIHKICFLKALDRSKEYIDDEQFLESVYRGEELLDFP